MTGLSLLQTTCLESAADRLETLTFDCFTQEQTEEFSVSCCLHREHYVNSGMRHRSACRGRTTSHCCTVTVNDKEEMMMNFRAVFNDEYN